VVKLGDLGEGPHGGFDTSATFVREVVATCPFIICSTMFIGRLIAAEDPLYDLCPQRQRKALLKAGVYVVLADEAKMVHGGSPYLHRTSMQV
jgi:hypothetical protein